MPSSARSWINVKKNKRETAIFFMAFVLFKMRPKIQSKSELQIWKVALSTLKRPKIKFCSQEIKRSEI
jgi:hypothetical protein